MSGDLRVCVLAMRNGYWEWDEAVYAVEATYEAAVARIVEELAEAPEAADGVTYDLHHHDRITHVTKHVGSLPAAVVDAARAASWEA